MNTPSLQELQAAEALLLRPVRQCGVYHENIMRGAKGEGLFEVSYDQEDAGKVIPMYLPECSPDLKHPACPHFMSRFGEALMKPLEKLAETDGECCGLKNEFKSLHSDQINIDRNIRFARTGTHEQQQLRQFPDRETAEANAAPHLAEFERTCARIDELRLLLLAKVRAAIATIDR